MQPTSTSHTPALNSFTNEYININEEASVNYWLAALECSEFELRVAVAAVGSGVKDVGTELGRVV